MAIIGDDVLGQKGRGRQSSREGQEEEVPRHVRHFLVLLASRANNGLGLVFVLNY